MEENPLVSVCMPAYNAGKYIKESVSSVINQSYNNLELIIINDGSTDETQTIIENIDDLRISLINSPNGGAAAARNHAFQYAKGKYLIFFDADDIMQANFIESQLNAITGYKNAVVISGWGRFYNDDISTFTPIEMNEEINSFADWIKEYWYKVNPMTNPGRILISRNLVEAAGPWDETLSLNDDLEYFTRVFLKSESLILNRDTFLYYRSGVNGLSSFKSDKAYNSLFQTVKLSVDYVCAAYPNDRVIQKSCANMWQSIVYELYPKRRSLAKKATAEVKNLNGSDLSYPAGGFSYLLSRLFGWKLAKRLKLLLS